MTKTATQTRTKVKISQAAKAIRKTRTKGLSVAIVGAGRLGTALAIALEASGYEVTALVARRQASAARSARRLSVRPKVLNAEALALIPDSAILIIATPDDQIAEVALRLAASLPEPHPANLLPHRRATRVAFHASGALTSGVLAPLAARGFATGSLHPLISVADASANAEDLRGAFYCVEGDARALRLARRIVRDLKGHSFSVAARDKALYHAAAAVASGHIVALFDLATELLARCGLPEPHARRVLLSLARTTLANLAAVRTNADALTGPLARADLSTVLKHLAALRATGERDAPAIYALLGARALQLAAQQGAASRATLREIERALAGARTRL